MYSLRIDLVVARSVTWKASRTLTLVLNEMNNFHFYHCVPTAPLAVAPAALLSVPASQYYHCAAAEDDEEVKK